MLLALASMCPLRRIPFDAALVLRELPPPCTLETLLHAARRIGFEVGAPEARPEEIRALGTPCLALFKATIERHQSTADGGVPAPGTATHRVAVVLPIYPEQGQAFEKLTREGYAGRMLYVEKQRDRIEKELDLKVQEFAIQSLSASIDQGRKLFAQLYVLSPVHRSPTRPGESVKGREVATAAREALEADTDSAVPAAAVGEPGIAAEGLEAWFLMGRVPARPPAAAIDAGRLHSHARARILICLRGDRVDALRVLLRAQDIVDHTPVDACATQFRLLRIRELQPGSGLVVPPDDFLSGHNLLR